MICHPLFLPITKLVPYLKDLQNQWETNERCPKAGFNGFLHFLMGDDPGP